MCREGSWGGGCCGDPPSSLSIPSVTAAPAALMGVGDPTSLPGSRGLSCIVIAPPFSPSGEEGEINGGLNGTAFILRCCAAGAGERTALTSLNWGSASSAITATASSSLSTSFCPIPFLSPPSFSTPPTPTPPFNIGLLVNANTPPSPPSPSTLALPLANVATSAASLRCFLLLAKRP